MIKQIYVIINAWRCILPIFVFISDKELKRLFLEDLERLTLASNFVKANLTGFIYSLLRFNAFRAVFYYRSEKHRIVSLLARLFLHNKLQMEISGTIEGGFVLYHGQSAIIHCTRAGKNFSVYQNVTVGRNKDHISEGVDKPIIGDNVSIYPGAVVVGGIRIGNNCEIAANSVVLKSVPNNCTIAVFMLN